MEPEGIGAMQSRRFSALPLIGVFAIIYVIAGKIGLHLASLHASASPVWPPAGIAISGFGNNGDIERSLQAGFSEHLIKPVKLDNLEAAIERALGAT
jgi:response regulator of citrate/malate metabolism